MSPTFMTPSTPIYLDHCASTPTDPRAFEDDYRSALAKVLGEAKLDVPADQRPILGGRRGHHREHLGHILAPMQYLQRTYPDAKW